MVEGERERERVCGDIVMWRESGGFRERKWRYGNGDGEVEGEGRF